MHLPGLVTVVLMGAATYATRVLGYLWLGERVPSARVRALMQTAPGCVLVAVIAPNVATTHPADLLGLGITLLAASRLPVLPTVVIAVVGTGLLRHLLPGTL